MKWLDVPSACLPTYPATSAASAHRLIVQDMSKANLLLKLENQSWVLGE